MTIKFIVWYLLHGIYTFCMRGDASIAFGPDFGCIHFENKTDGGDK